MAKNKVLFGFSNLYIGTYNVADDGTVTLGAPYHQKGAVGYSPEENADKSDFYADNTAYYTTYSGGTHEGDLTVAMFDDEFKENFLGYVKLDNGGIAKVKNPVKPNVYIAFEVDGDQEKRRVIMYNGTLGSINREYATTEDTKEPQTESIATTFVGDNATGITMVTFRPEDDGYNTLFTSPAAPALPTESE